MINEQRPVSRTQATQIATAGDAAWFGSHADRRLRIRNMVPGEFDDVTGPAPVGMAWRTIVLEAQPGARSRQAIALPIGTAIDDLADEDLFDLFVQVAPPGARDVIATLRRVKLPRV
ncbi:hypothetical protein U1701_05540 [Sphingomonas sp. PB2P19]|uniref:hypothetical protein n=1 Tax=Sphingomonas rhamnosi TaxID=3096156 RepID=UPI002FCC5B2A